MKKIVSLVIILSAIFFGYKGYLLIKYNVSATDINTNDIFKDELNIIKKDYQENLFTYENISFKNDFKDYIKNENNWYIKKDKDGNVISAIYLTKMSQYYNLLTDGNLEITSDENKIIVDEIFNEKDKDTFLKENNINNDVDLLNYIKRNYYLKNNILTCAKKIKQNYIINSFVQISMPTFSKITLINGDLTGYILSSSEKIRQIHILNKDQQFIITLVGESLVKDDYITSFLESIKLF